MRLPALIAVAAIAAAPAVAAAQAVAFGLSKAQIEEADLVDARGRDIGDVHRVVTGANGAVTGLVVEVDRPDPQPDKLVMIPMTGLKAVPERADRTDINIQTPATLAELQAMPEWKAG